MEQIFKIGGVYKKKDCENGWVLVQRKIGEKYLIHDIEIDGNDYDDEIYEISKEKLSEMVEPECYNGVFRNGIILYKVWDGANRDTIKIVYNV